MRGSAFGAAFRLKPRMQSCFKTLPCGPQLAMQLHHKIVNDIDGGDSQPRHMASDLKQTARWL